MAKRAREAVVMPLAAARARARRGLLRDVPPEADAARGHELYRLTEGQPLFVVEALRLGADAEGRTRWTHDQRQIGGA